MKVKEGFILRKVGRQYVVAATGEASRNFNGMLRLNEEAAFAFSLLQKGIAREELMKAVTEKYPAETESTVDAFLEALKEADAFV